MTREPDFVDECYADTDLSLLKKLTLIIPTYNRNYYLSRCLWYHAHFPFGEIIVADSSPEEKKVVNRDTVAKVRDMFGAKVRYLEYMPETEKYGRDIMNKWCNAMQSASSDFVQQISDREFLQPKTEQRLLDYLSCNLDYSVADADWYNIIKLSGNNILCEKVAQNRFSLNSNEPLLRLISAGTVTNGTSNLMAIRRTSFNKRLYQLLIKNNLDDTRFFEFTLEFLTIINSKIYYHAGYPMTAKDFSNFSTPWKINKMESGNSRYLNLSDYMSKGIYDDLYQSFTTLIADELEHNGCIIERDDVIHILNHIIPQVLEKRGFFGPTNPVEIISSKYPIISKIGRLLIKKNSCSNHDNEELKTVVESISKYNKYYKKDKAIL